MSVHLWTLRDSFRESGKCPCSVLAESALLEASCARVFGGLRWRSNSAGADDKAVWRRADVVKRKACDQRKRVPARRFQDAHIAGRNHFGGFHFVLKIAMDRLQRDCVT